MGEMGGPLAVAGAGVWALVITACAMAFGPLENRLTAMDFSVSPDRSPNASMRYWQSIFRTWGPNRTSSFRQR